MFKSACFWKQYRYRLLVHYKNTFLWKWWCHAHLYYMISQSIINCMIFTNWHCHLLAWHALFSPICANGDCFVLETFQKHKWIPFSPKSMKLWNEVWKKNVHPIVDSNSLVGSASTYNAVALWTSRVRILAWLLIWKDSLIYLLSGFCIWLQ